MTRNFTKITAALVATLTISAAAASFTTDTASARMMGGERMGMGRMGHGMGHGGMGRMSHGHYRHGGGFGRGAAIGFGAAIVGAAIVAAANQPYIESVDTQTGERVRSSGQPGRHVVTRNDGKGKVDKKIVAREPDSASVVEGKRTASSTADGKGQRDVVNNDGNGNVQNSKSGGEPASMSWTDPSTGVTTTITSNGKGGNNMVRTNAAGEVLP